MRNGCRLLALKSIHQLLYLYVVVGYLERLRLDVQDLYDSIAIF